MTQRRLAKNTTAVKVNVRNTLIYLSLVLGLWGCGASFHIKRARKLAPELFVTRIDTVRDTIRITIPKVDTLFQYRFDTVEMWLDKVYIKYHHDTVTNQVLIEADCPDSEIVTETITEIKEVPYVVPLTFGAVLRYFLKFWYVGAIILLIVSVKVFWRFIKPF